MILRSFTSLTFYLDYNLNDMVSRVLVVVISKQEPRCSSMYFGVICPGVIVLKVRD